MNTTKKYTWYSSQTYHNGFNTAVLYTYIPK